MKIPQSVRELLSRTPHAADNSANAEISAAFSIGSLSISESYAWSSDCWSASGREAAKREQRL
jgi:hypothetical protein